MSKYKRLGKNTILVFIGNLGSKLIALIMLPFYTKCLTVEDFGISDIILVYATFFIGIISLSISESVFIFPKNQSKEKQSEYFSSGLFYTFFCLIIAAILFYITKYIFTIYNIENSFTKYVWIIFFLAIVMFLQKYFQQFTRSIDKMKVYAITGVILQTLIAVFSFLLIFFLNIACMLDIGICSDISKIQKFGTT